MPAGRPALFMIGHSELLAAGWSKGVPSSSLSILCYLYQSSFTTWNEGAKESISCSNEDKDPIYSTTFIWKGLYFGLEQLQIGSVSHKISATGTQSNCYAMFITFLFLFGSVIAFLSSVESTGFMRKSIISPDTVRILKGVSFYHSGYFLSSAILSWFFISFILSKLPQINPLDSVIAIWALITDFVTRLENNEYSYQCHFGLSIRSVRCEVYGNINRMLLLTTYQCLKYMQESFSYSDFNIFRILGFFAFLNTSIRQLISIVKPLKLVKIIINNSILLVVHVVNGVYTVYNWRMIVQRLVIEEEIQNSKKLLKAKQGLVPLTITIAKSTS